MKNELTKKLSKSEINEINKNIEILKNQKIDEEKCVKFLNLVNK